MQGGSGWVAVASSVTTQAPGAPPRVLQGVHVSVLFCVSQSEVQGFQSVLTECESFSAPFRSAGMETRKALKAGIK